MNFVIPMAGRGQRFTEAGYHLPKMLIQAKSKSLLEWSVDSLPLDLCSNLIFIGLKEHEEKFDLSGFIKSKYENKVNLKFIFIDKTTRGQAETVLKGKTYIDTNHDLLIYNIDTCFNSSSLREKLLKKDIDGVVGAFHDNSNKFSFAKIGSDGFITNVQEKEPISNNALTGLYHFSNPYDFIGVAEESICKNKMTKGEFYIAPMYNDLIAKGKKFILDVTDEIDILGTPNELENFLNKKHE